MLIAIFTVLMLFFGGGSLEFYLTNLKGSVKEQVQDKDRRDAILDTSKALEKDLKVLAKDVEQHFNALVSMHTRFESTSADYDTAAAKLKADQKTLSTLTLGARDAMHKQMTREEWNAVFSSSNDSD